MTDDNVLDVSDVDGAWIAVKNNELIAEGDDPETVRKEAEDKLGHTKFAVTVTPDPSRDRLL